MSLKDLIKKSGLVEFDETATDEDTPSVSTSSKAAKRPTAPLKPLARVATTTIYPPATSTVMGPDPEIVAILEQATNDSKTTGYPEFRAIFETLDGIAELQRYAMALKLTQTSHKISTAGVLASLDDRLAILEAQQADFESNFQQSINDSVTSVQTQADKIAATIEQMKADIQAKETEKASLIEKAAAAQITLEKERSAFNASYDVVHTNISGERAKIASQQTPTK
jgi:hypothetical protein